MHQNSWEIFLLINMLQILFKASRSMCLPTYQLWWFKISTRHTTPPPPILLLCIKIHEYAYHKFYVWTMSHNNVVTYMCYNVIFIALFKNSCTCLGISIFSFCVSCKWVNLYYCFLSIHNSMFIIKLIVMTGHQHLHCDQYPPFFYFNPILTCDIQSKAEMVLSIIFLTVFLV